MANLTPKQFNLSEINNGLEYEDGDGVQPNLFNDCAEGAAYCDEQLQAVVQSPDISEANQTGTLTISWVDTTVNGRPYKKLKFANMKGNSGNPTGNILQTTGTSTEDTMSQNAITTQLSKKQNATIINTAGTATNFEITATRFATEFYCFGNAAVTITQDGTSYYSATTGGQYKIYRRANLISIIRTQASITLANVDISVQTITLANNSNSITLSISNGYAVGVINELA